MSSFREFEFYWVRKNIIAGSSRPKSEDHLRYISQQGIKRIISIAEPNLVKLHASAFDIEVIPFEFIDFGIPSLDQIKEFISIMDDSHKKNFPVLIHCAMGCGRTGLLLTLYIMYYDHRNWNDSLLELRSVRPCAVESNFQMNFLENFSFSNLK